MKLALFLKDKWFFIFAQSLIIAFLTVLLSMMDIGISAIILICLSNVFLTVSSLFYEFMKKRSYYNELYCLLEGLDKKQYIASVLKEPDFMEADILFDVIKQATKAMNDEIAYYKRSGEEYRDYIEAWIHEIKLPISCVNLMCENNNNETTKSIADEMSRIDTYVEQALYYARSTNVEKDYSVREVLLDTIVKKAVKKHLKQLIACKTELSIKEIDKTIYCDPKWLEFILGQLFSNSIKYKKETLMLNISAEESNDNITLFIEDNGIGIQEKDLKRVFEKGFTGENGRAYTKSTGIGLYLCKRLCDKMNLGLEITSEVDKGSVVKMVFPKDSRILLEN